uniref:Ankyrin repeat domain-containing protein 6 n=1 Tax=Plectus sambesii TaxID=2011161 RepID=A0A914WCB7_9BILA
MECVLTFLLLINAMTRRSCAGSATASAAIADALAPFFTTVRVVHRRRWTLTVTDVFYPPRSSRRSYRHCQMESGNTALHEAAARGDKDAVRSLLRDNANLYIRNKSGATALHLACQFGRTTCVRLLLEAGCRTNVTDTYDDTPLHTAVRYLQVSATKTLLVYNANPNERNKNDDTPLHLSCNLGHRKLSKMLLQAGASRSGINCQGETPMDISARKQCEELMTLLRTAPSSSHNKDSIKRWGKDRRNQIRMKLQAAREAGSNWHLLFQDFDPTTQPGLSPANSKTNLPSLRKGEQYFIDLAGKVHKGNCKDKDNAGVNCYCAPIFSKLIKQNTTAHQELLDEIDACHDELSHEISDLRQVTERKLADLHRDLRHYRPRHRRHTREDSSSPAAGRLIRCKSESEIEADHLSPDAHSNASDDIYIERYFRPLPKQSTNKGTANRDKRSITGSRQSSSDNQTTSSHLSKIQAACQETMRQFNCLDLDDTCTTPTSASSHRTSRSSHRRLTGDSYSLASTADKHTEAVYAANTSHRASIYSSRSGGDAGPQPPSLDSGYGTGFSPSPARPSPAGDAWPVSPSVHLNEIGTQTEEDTNEYTELESAVVVRASVAVKRPLPRLPIPPPPTKPLPPLPRPHPPTSTSSRKAKHANPRIYCVSTNV